MDIACLMGLFPKEYKEEILRNSICSVQNAANKLQWNIVEGLDENLDRPVKIFNSLYIGSSPHKYSSLKIPSFSFKHCKNANDLNIGFNNRSIIKYFSKYMKIKLAMKEWIDSNERDKVLIVYAMTTPFMQLIRYIKRRNKKITICLVVPDLPDYMNLTSNKNFAYLVLKKLQNLIFRNCNKSVDCFVLLTDQMKDWFKYNINYTVVEGITTSTIDFKSYAKKKSILYSGMIEKKYGVVDLVKSFLKIDNSEWILDIYGDGLALEEISKIKNSNVILHGTVPNSEVVVAQKERRYL